MVVKATLSVTITPLQRFGELELSIHNTPSSSHSPSLCFLSLHPHSQPQIFTETSAFRNVFKSQSPGLDPALPGVATEGHSHPAARAGSHAPATGRVRTWDAARAAEPLMFYSDECRLKDGSYVSYFSFKWAFIVPLGRHVAAMACHSASEGDGAATKTHTGF